MKNDERALTAALCGLMALLFGTVWVYDEDYTLYDQTEKYDAF